jgi:hypothetical protein
VLAWELADGRGRVSREQKTERLVEAGAGILAEHHPMTVCANCSTA